MLELRRLKFAYRKGAEALTDWRGCLSAPWRERSRKDDIAAPDGRIALSRQW